MGDMVAITFVNQRLHLLLMAMMTWSPKLDISQCTRVKIWFYAEYLMVTPTAIWNSYSLYSTTTLIVITMFIIFLYNVWSHHSLFDGYHGYLDCVWSNHSLVQPQCLLSRGLGLTISSLVRLNLSKLTSSSSDFLKTKPFFILIEFHLSFAWFDHLDVKILRCLHDEIGIVNGKN